MKYLEMKKRAFMSIVNAVKGFVRKVSGTPPITLPDCVDNDSIISYSIEGNSVQNGEPTPENPIEVESVGEKTENLFDAENAQWTGVGTAIKIAGMGAICINYTVGNGSYQYAHYKFPYDSLYSVSYISDAGKRVLVRFLDIDGNNISSSHVSKITGGTYNSAYNGIFKDNVNSVEIPYEEDSGIAYFQIGFVAVGTTVTYMDIQVKKGASSEYEPYGKYKIPIKMSGKNLFDINSVNSLTAFGGVKCYIVNADKTITCRYPMFAAASPLPCNIKELSAGTYTISAEIFTSKDAESGSHSVYIGVRTPSGTKSKYHVLTHDEWTIVSHTFTLEESQTILGIIIQPSGNSSSWNYGKAVGIQARNIQIEESATASNCEPYVEPITTNIYLDEPLKQGEALEYPNDDIPKLPTTKGTTIYSVETGVQPTNMNVEYYSTRKEV